MPAFVAVSVMAATVDKARTRIGAAEAGWFLCDGVDAPHAALVGKPLPDGRLDVVVLDKMAANLAPRRLRYRVSSPERGAGQIYWPLSVNGREAGSFHAFNPGAFGEEGAVRTPPFTSVQLGDDRFQCRWLANSRLIALGRRRSIVVREDRPSHLVYESFDYAAPSILQQPDGAQRTTRPSQRVIGGTEVMTGGTTRFRFENDDYAYSLTVPSHGAATLSVLRGDRIVQTETLLGYTFAPR